MRLTSLFLIIAVLAALSCNLPTITNSKNDATILIGDSPTPPTYGTIEVRGDVIGNWGIKESLTKLARLDKKPDYYFFHIIDDDPKHYAYLQIVYLPITEPGEYQYETKYRTNRHEDAHIKLSWGPSTTREATERDENSAWFTIYSGVARIDEITDETLSGSIKGEFHGIDFDEGKKITVECNFTARIIMDE